MKGEKTFLKSSFLIKIEISDNKISKNNSNEYIKFGKDIGFGNYPDW